MFVNNLANGVMDLVGDNPGVNCDCLRVVLSNTSGSVNPTLATLSQVAQIAAVNGYVAGGLPLTGGVNTGASSAGTFTLEGTVQTWTAVGGAMAPFRYAILYDDTPTSPNKPLIGAWDYGYSLTLAEGETFTVKFDSSSPTGTILTVI